jgi:hypothetical protein
VSPNKTDALTDKIALQKLNSFEESNAMAVADRIVCSFTWPPHGQVSAVLGLYGTSAENSLIVETGLEVKPAEYVAALLGLYEQQRNVLLFVAKPGAGDRLWLIESRRPFDSVAAAFRQNHLIPLSMRIEKSSVQIWLVDLGDKMGQRPQELAERLGATASSEDGATEFLGDENDRVKAEAVYRRKIQDFEKHSVVRYSSSLSRVEWRKASTRTCSTELQR